LSSCMVSLRIEVARTLSFAKEVLCVLKTVCHGERSAAIASKRAVRVPSGFDYRAALTT
jgi:hypothetical protein